MSLYLSVGVQVKHLNEDGFITHTPSLMKTKLILALVAMFIAFLPSCTYTPNTGYSSSYGGGYGSSYNAGYGYGGNTYRQTGARAGTRLNGPAASAQSVSSISQMRNSDGSYKQNVRIGNQFYRANPRLVQVRNNRTGKTEIMSVEQAAALRQKVGGGSNGDPVFRNGQTGAMENPFFNFK